MKVCVLAGIVSARQRIEPQYAVSARQRIEPQHAVSTRQRIEPQYAENITVYHVNRKNYSSVPMNMNTADLRGDMYFDMRTKALGLECGIWYNHSFWSHLDCTNDEVATRAEDLAITKLVLEVDRRYGSYADCNVADGLYSCDCHTHTQANCPTLNASQCDDYHVGYGCWWRNSTSSCDVWSCFNSTTEGDCAQNFYSPDTCAWNDATSKCDVIATPVPTPAPFGGHCNASTVGMEDLRTVDWGRHDGGSGSNMTEIAAWHDNLITKVGGLWFSTQEAGHCDSNSDSASDFCSWRVAKVVKKIHKKCSDDAINAAVIKYDTTSPGGQRCFSKCSAADMANTSSICFVRCFYTTVLGPGSDHSNVNITGGMPLEALDAAWSAPFNR